MSDEERGSETIRPPEWRGRVTLYDDRVGMTAEQLLGRADEAFKELCDELAVLHRQLPRKSEPRLRRTAGNKKIVTECIAGARARVQIAGRTMAGLAGR